MDSYPNVPPDQCRHGWRADQCPYRYNARAPMGACAIHDAEGAGHETQTSTEPTVGAGDMGGLGAHVHTCGQCGASGPDVVLDPLGDAYPDEGPFYVCSSCSGDDESGPAVATFLSGNVSDDGACVWCGAPGETLVLRGEGPFLTDRPGELVAWCGHCA